MVCSYLFQSSVTNTLVSTNRYQLRPRDDVVRHGKLSFAADGRSVVPIRDRRTARAGVAEAAGKGWVMTRIRTYQNKG